MGNPKEVVAIPCVFKHVFEPDLAEPLVDVSDDEIRPRLLFGGSYTLPLDLFFWVWTVLVTIWTFWLASHSGPVC